MPIFFLAALMLSGSEADILDRAHHSQVFNETRNYRIFLPPDYQTSGKRYPVVYWFHGYSERYNQPVAGTPHHNYDQGSDYGGDTIAGFVGAHDVIVVKWDGYNPRRPGEDYPRPYNIQPVETSRQFPLYFPELVRYIDANYRTIPDREHRATSGLSMGGFMSFWIAGKYPDLVSSASNFMGSSEFVVGPKDFPVEYRHDEMHGNYDGLRTRLVTGTRDFIRFYHQRMNRIWMFTRPDYETEEFESDHGTPGMAKTLDFHMRAFANPPPPPVVWNHIDVYPKFEAWDWSVDSDRTQPGFTQLENVSATGFRSCAREWVPGGRALSGVKLTIVSGRLYPPGKGQTITTIRLRDGAVRRAIQKADAQGRLHFELDGDDNEVGIGAGSILAVAGFDWHGARSMVRFCNKGATASEPIALHWETPNPGVELKTGEARLPRIEPGKMVSVPVAFTVSDTTREVVKLFAAGPGVRLPVEIPVFPPAARIDNFQISDGRQFRVYQEAVKLNDMALGSGNGDGKANPGERIAILIPDGGDAVNAWRAAELFTNDRCVDLSTRISDGWAAYDHVGASVKYSLPLIRGDCPAGHIVRMLARWQLPSKPNHRVRYGAIEFRVQ
ncbi:MAG: alpha/beta hydrolase [Bryobacteraceae bacterium]